MERNRERPVEYRRLRLLLAGGVALVGVFIFRFFYVQIIHYDHYAQAIARQSVRRINLYPERGEIVDGAGQLLAVNVPPAEGQPEAADPAGPHRRRYPFGERAGQVLGFVGKDGYGLAGVEYGFDRKLFGEEGWLLVRQDARQRRFVEPSAPVKRPEDGYSVELTLNIRIQEIVEQCLKEGVETTGALSGVAVALDPQDGDILAMANYPFFDPNLPASERDRRDWSNRAVTMIYEPGSTFKVVTASAALEEGVFRESDVIHTGDGKLKVFDEIIHDTHAYGDVTFAQALAVSSNIAFAKIATALGPDRLYRYVRNFGFGQKTGVELPGEEEGLFKPIEKWSGRTLVTVAMGQEVSVTPLQLASAYAAMANGGVLYAPRIVKRLMRDGEIVKEFAPVPVRRVVKQQTSERLVRCFQSVVDLPEGTGKMAKIEGLAIGGKTGTAEKVDAETGLYQKDKFHASFVGFFPASHPIFLCLVVLNEPRKLHTGGLTAAPVFRNIAVRLLHAPELAFGAKCLVPLADNSSQAGVAAVAASPDSLAGVPNVVGLQLRHAMGLLNQFGLTVTAEGRGKVKSQFPAAGEKFKSGQKTVVCRLTAG